MRMLKQRPKALYPAGLLHKHPAKPSYIVRVEYDHGVSHVRHILKGSSHCMFLGSASCRKPRLTATNAQQIGSV